RHTRFSRDWSSDVCSSDLTFSTGCANPVIEASVTLNDESVLSVELDPIHPYLAEYDRTAVLRNPGASPVRQKLFLDTGGYTAPKIGRASGREREWRACARE